VSDWVVIQEWVSEAHPGLTFQLCIPGDLIEAVKENGIIGQAEPTIRIVKTA
jgi:hypothetical protein